VRRRRGAGEGERGGVVAVGRLEIVTQDLQLAQSDEGGRERRPQRQGAPEVGPGAVEVAACACRDAGVVGPAEVLRRERRGVLEARHGGVQQQVEGEGPAGFAEDRRGFGRGQGGRAGDLPPGRFHLLAHRRLHGAGVDGRDWLEDDAGGRAGDRAKRRRRGERRGRGRHDRRDPDDQARLFEPAEAGAPDGPAVERRLAHWVLPVPSRSVL
jgi:hypothetical protein